MLSHSPSIVTDGLVLCLDAANPRSYGGSGTNWGDLSGNGNNGTLTNGPTFDTGSLGSIQFDGVNDYITFGNKTVETFGLTTSAGATMSCWLKINLLNRWTGVFIFYSPYSCDFGWDITSTNLLRVWKDNAGSNGPSLVNYSNEWTNYVIVSDSISAKFYINGNIFYTFSKAGNIFYSTGHYLVFGDHWDNPVSGSSNLLQIYNRALSPQEIEQNFKATRGRFGI